MNRLPESARIVLSSSLLTDTHRMRIISCTALAAMLAFPHPAHAQGFDDAGFCQALQEIAVNKERGSRPNEYVSRIAVTVHCDMKIVQFKMRLGVPINDLRSGWQEHTHVLLNQMYCQGPMRAAIDKGWTVAFTIMSADGERHYMTPECR